MPHATEGELHAWLDGALDDAAPGRREAVAAHVEGCPDCRARLDEARTLRERASGILETAGPERVEPPPFESVLAERERRGGAARAGEAADGAGTGAGGGRRWMGSAPAALAWAASIALAVGAGWVLRSAAVSPADPAATARRAAEPAVESGRVASRPPEPARAGNAAAGAAVEAAGEPQDAAAGEAAGAADEERRRSRLARAAPAETDPAGGAIPAIPRPSEADRSEAVPNELEERRRPVGAGRTAPAPPLDEGAVWVQASRADARRWLGASPLAVAGLPVREVAVSVRAGERVVRVRQALASGERLELVQVAEAPAAGAPAADLPPGAAASPTALRDEGGQPADVDERRAREIDSDAAAAKAADAPEGGGVISGRVVATSGAPLEGVQVSLPGSDRGGLTDAAGRYAITGVPGGRVAVAARSIGFREERRELVVPSRDTTRVDFRLEPEPVALEEVTVTSVSAEPRALVVGRDGVRVTATSDVSPDSLRRLLERLERLP